MFEILATGFVQISAILLPAMAIGVLSVGAMRSGIGLGRGALALGGIALLLAGWHVMIVPLAKAGIMAPPQLLGDPPAPLINLAAMVLAIWAWARFTATGRMITGALDQRLFMGFQSMRVAGGLFLIGWAMGALPWQFAIPAGIGDVWAGIAGIQAMRAVSRGDANATALVWRANIIGLVDFVVAVTLGIVTTQGALHLISVDTVNIVNDYPLAMFPGFIVPVFLVFQVLSVTALLRQSRQITPANSMA